MGGKTSYPAFGLSIRQRLFQLDIFAFGSR
jgi:hypothetical protein